MPSTCAPPSHPIWTVTIKSRNSFSFDEKMVERPHDSSWKAFTRRETEKERKSRGQKDGQVSQGNLSERSCDKRMTAQCPTAGPTVRLTGSEHLKPLPPLHHAFWNHPRSPIPVRRFAASCCPRPMVATVCRQDTSGRRIGCAVGQGNSQQSRASTAGHGHQLRAELVLLLLMAGVSGGAGLSGRGCNCHVARIIH